MNYKSERLIIVSKRSEKARIEELNQNDPREIILEAAKIYVHYRTGSHKCKSAYSNKRKEHVNHQNDKKNVDPVRRKGTKERKILRSRLSKSPA